MVREKPQKETEQWPGTKSKCVGCHPSAGKKEVENVVLREFKNNNETKL